MMYDSKQTLNILWKIEKWIICVVKSVQIVFVISANEEIELLKLTTQNSLSNLYREMKSLIFHIHLCCTARCSRLTGEIQLGAWGIQKTSISFTIIINSQTAAATEQNNEENIKLTRNGDSHSYFSDMIWRWAVVLGCDENQKNKKKKNRHTSSQYLTERSDSYYMN